MLLSVCCSCSPCHPQNSPPSQYVHMPGLILMSRLLCSFSALLRGSLAAPFLMGPMFPSAGPFLQTQEGKSSQASPPPQTVQVPAPCTHFSELWLLITPTSALSSARMWLLAAMFSLYHHPQCYGSVLQ